MLPNKLRGVPRVGDRRVLDGTFWESQFAAPGRDAPDDLGADTTCYRRLVRTRGNKIIRGASLFADVALLGAGYLVVNGAFFRGCTCAPRSALETASGADFTGAISLVRFSEGVPEQPAVDDVHPDRPAAFSSLRPNVTTGALKEAPIAGRIQQQFHDPPAQFALHQGPHSRIRQRR